jgi:hypothetical protein
LFGVFSKRCGVIAAQDRIVLGVGMRVCAIATSIDVARAQNPANLKIYLRHCEFS